MGIETVLGYVYFHEWEAKTTAMYVYSVKTLVKILLIFFTKYTMFFVDNKGCIDQHVLINWQDEVKCL